MTIPFHTPRGTIDLLALRPEDMAAEIFAESLAKQNRFGGRTPEPWSVAAHSVLVEMISPPEYRPWALLHDAHEVFLGDLMTPSVDLLCHFGTRASVLNAISNTKGRLDRQIAAAWKVPVMSMVEPLRRADHIAYLAEVWTFMGISPGILSPDEADQFDRAVSCLRDMSIFDDWRNAADLWLGRVEIHAKLGHFAPPRLPTADSAVLAG